MTLTRRQTMLTLARLEWNAIIHHLEVDPDTSDATGRALANLKQRLAQTSRDPDELVTVSQAPLEWSPVILALSLKVLRDPGLLPLAERLRDQMAAQSKRMESRLTQEELAGEMRKIPMWPDDFARRILNTN